MKILRALRQRGSSLATAGYFTVLHQNRWASAARLTHESQLRHGRLGEAPAEVADAPLEWNLFESGRRHFAPVRTAMIVVAAMLLTAGALLLLY